MKIRILLCLMLAFVFCSGPMGTSAQQKDYLTSIEADRIRDAETSNDRIKLFLRYAADRMKKFQYELARPANEPRRAERLNSLLNAYTGCVDDAADLVGIGVEKQEDIRLGIKEMQAKSKEFLAYLTKLAEGSPDSAIDQDTLKDAIEATRDAQQEADKAAKDIAPPPVRRKQ